MTLKNENVKIAGAVIVSILIVSMFSFIFFKAYYKKHCKPKVIKQTITKTVVKTVVQKIPENKIDENKLANWIYHHSYRCSRKQAKEYAELILKTKHPLLIASIIKNESSFNVSAVSSSNAIGLMQILPTKEHLRQLKEAKIIKDKRDLFDAEVNIKAGEFIFDDILRLNDNNISKALLMYCGGNKSYVNRVLQTLGQLTIEVKGD